ncbi:hypothetical protein MEPL4_4c00150 [Melissococcus plutonius]|uniref:hypothetical protein n=1 Tax=Melissococcus plutonius TaxID=33970 RepID=UPI00065E6F4D|nr:hypothetical protein [Melissococcus plutonius]AIM25745.1 hypothetical protein MEPL_c009950 [Melissococcus plutonius S1]KMT23426.1 hypothetical protein MEPL2_43p00080 [Melissococcus plutonius]KMT25184.1 hypothetical protein MEPL2_2c07420 [Melissococcus plutonius]KMT26090.1 hypothetical protein MEPL3_3c00150 [Melissococcus plutonius]KMT26820.1 hypothetical protein MEPL1_4c00150 [Melissococcus plutonius]
MKKILAGLLFLSCALFVIPQAAFAAGPDGETVLDNNGNPMHYGTKYILKDYNIPKGGVTYETWASYDYAIFSNDQHSDGTAIVFEKRGKTPGDVIISGDKNVIVRSTHANWGDYVYWVPSHSLWHNAIWFGRSSEAIATFIISADKNSRHIGIGNITLDIETGKAVWNDYHGAHDSKAWMKGESFLNPGNSRVNPVEASKRMTPFYCYPAN